jgi:hypothetical protein
MPPGMWLRTPMDRQLPSLPRAGFCGKEFFHLENPYQGLSGAGRSVQKGSCTEGL